MAQLLTTRLARIAAVPAVLVAGALALAQPALATDYCVQPNTTCGGTQVDKLQVALDLAAFSPNADRIFLGTYKYIAPVATGFTYDRNDGPVEIVGAGNGNSVITGQSGGSHVVLRMFGGPGSSLHDLEIKMPDSVATSTIALWTNAVAKHISVVDNPITNANPRSGVALDGGVLDDSAVQMQIHGQTGGVSFQSAGGTIRDSTVAARVAVASSYGGVVDRTGISASAVGVGASRGVTTVTSSEIYVDGLGSMGIDASVNAGENTTVFADGVNIIGTPGQTPIAVSATTSYAPASSVDVTVKNSIIRNFTTALDAGASGAGHAHITASYSDYSAPSHTSGASAAISETNILNTGVAEGDEGWVQVPGSPLIDAGDPAEAQGLDYVGNPLVTDGNLDGNARRDIGAFEFPGPLPGAGDQPAAQADPTAAPTDQAQVPAPVAAPARVMPLVSGFSTLRKRFTIPRGTRFSYKLNKAATVVVAIKRSGHTVAKLTRPAKAGANSIRFSGRIGKRALRPGRYRAEIRATDATGNHSAVRRLSFRVVRR